MRDVFRSGADDAGYDVPETPVPRHRLWRRVGDNFRIGGEATLGRTVTRVIRLPIVREGLLLKDVLAGSARP